MSRLRREADLRALGNRMTTEREEILEKLIATEWPKLRRFFGTKVPEGEVLDLVQNTMLAYVEGDARRTAEPRPYLWGIARLQVLKYYERHRRPTQPFDSALHTAMDLGTSLSSAFEKRGRLVAALRALPADQQIAIELRHGEGLKLEEVAAALGVSLATTKRYIAAAEEKLRVELGDLRSLAAEYAQL